MHVNRARSSIAAIVVIAVAGFVCIASKSVAQQQLPIPSGNAVRLDDSGIGEGVIWWVVGSGAVLGAGSDGSQLLSATVGQTAIDRVEYRSSNGRLYPSMTTWLGYWLPEVASRSASDASEMVPVTGKGLMAANHPNPFTTETKIGYQLPESGHVRLRIYDMQGLQVRQLFDGIQTAGVHRINWNGLDDAGITLSSGTYIYTIELLDSPAGIDGTENRARGIMHLVR